MIRLKQARNPHWSRPSSVVTLPASVNLRRTGELFMPNRARVAVVVLLICLITSALFAQTTYYFKGDPADQANKVANDTVSGTIGTATFDTSPPTGTAPVIQTGSQFTNEAYVGNPLD